MKVQTEHIMAVSGGGVRGHWTRKEIPMVGKLNPSSLRLPPALPHSSCTLKSLTRFLGLMANLSRGSLGAEQMFAGRALHSRNGVAAAAAVL